MKKLSVLLLSAILTLTVAVAGLSGTLLAHAESNPDALEKAPAVTVTNGDFEASTSASNWTGAYGASYTTGSYGGVLELAKINTSLKNFGFEESEIGSVVIPSGSAFGNNVLFLHNDQISVYKYTSSDITIPAHTYVELSLSVLTPDFADETYGAFVRFSGELSDVAFGPINTKGEWKTLKLLVKGFEYKTITTQISLQLGNDAVAGTDSTVKGVQGWAAFDNVSAYSMTGSKYDELLASTYGNHVIADGSVKTVNALTKSFLPEEYEKLSFAGASFERADYASAWRATEDSALTVVNTDVTSWTETKMTVSGEEKTLVNPLAPLSSENNILSMYGYPNESSHGGVETVGTITIPRFSYVRLSVWVNASDLFSGTATVSATVVEDGEDYNADADTVASVTSFTAQNTDNYTGDWAEAVILVKGSAFYDREIRLSLTAGSADSPFVGAVHFDAVSYQMITGSDYATLDKGATLEMKGAVAAETVTNGNFNTVGEATAEDALLPASDWTFASDDDNTVLHGISALDGTYFAALRAKEPALNLVDIPSDARENNALLVFHKEAAYSTYTSATITSTASAVNTVSVRVFNRLDGDARVRLNLYADDLLVSTKWVEQTATTGFTTYSLSVKTGTATPALKLELVLGEADEKVSGYAWFDTVFFAADTAATVADADLTTDLFDLVNDNGDKIMQNYAWSTVGTTSATAQAGFVRMKDYEGSGAYADLEALYKDAQTEYGLLLTASEKAYFGLKQKLATSYTASTFVRITLRVKTRGFAEGEGARIELNATNVLENVNSQYLTDAEKSVEGVSAEMDGEIYNGWRNFYFYVNVGATESQSTNLTVWIGSGANPSAQAQGTILIDSMTVETITETEYNDLVADYDEDNVTYFMNVQLSEAAEETPDDPTATLDNTGCTETAGWIVSSVLFAVAIVIAIVGFAIKKIKSRPHKQKPVKGAVSYDRRNTVTVLSSDKKAAPKTEETVEETTAEAPVEEAPEETAEPATEEAPAEEAPAPAEDFDHFED